MQLRVGDKPTQEHHKQGRFEEKILVIQALLMKTALKKQLFPRGLC